MMPARVNPQFRPFSALVSAPMAGLAARAAGAIVLAALSANLHAQQVPAARLPVQTSAAPVVLAPPSHAASAAAARAGDTIDAPERRDPSEPNVKRTVIEDEGSKVEELRVRGQTQRIVVTPKVGTKKSYEIITDSAGREMYDGSGASRGAVGKRVWNVFNF